MPRTRMSTVPFNQALMHENRLTSATMRKTGASKPAVAAEDPLALVPGGNNLLVLFLVMLACAATLLAFLSAQSAEPFVLTIMALFAMLGVFFVFGVAAGHVRLSERTSETELLRVLGDRIDDGVVLASQNGRAIYANRAAAQHLGRNELGALNSLEEALGGTPSGTEALFRLTGFASRGEAQSEEIMLAGPAADGNAGPAGDTERWLRVSVKPFGNIDVPELTGRAVIWSFTDITREKRQAARARRALEVRLGQFEAMPGGLISVDMDGRLLFISSSLSEWLVLDPDYIERPVMLTEIVAGDGAELLQSIGRVPGGDAIAPRIDLDLVRRDGRRWPATLVVQPRSDEESGKSGFNALVLARSDLAAQDADETLVGKKFASLFQSAPFGIATVSSECKVTSANGAFYRLLLDGRPDGPRQVDDVLGMHVDGEKRIEILAAIDDALAGRANIPPIEIEIGGDGEYTRRLFFNSLAGPKSEKGPFVVYVTDATEEKALGVKFAQSQKMEAVGKLAGGIAHDFNNVLTAIIGFSDLLLTSHRPGDHAYKNIQNIRSSANHAAGLVKQLLAFSRRQTLTSEVLQLNEVVTDLSVILNRLLGEDIELKISSGRDLWAVKADHNQLNQVVMNLAVNARDAMPGGGTLTIRTRNVTERESQRLSDEGLVVGQYVMIEVEDTGSGMSPEVLKKIFEPFFTTKGIGKGTGLGLSTVYGIIKQTGGYVYADSVVGEGTTFRVYLPRQFETEAPVDLKREAAPAEPKRDLTGKGRVLVVEDEDAVRMFAMEALRRQGYEVLEACDGVDALDILEDHDYEVDLVVSDVKMPEMDGPSLYNELRRTNHDLKFIFVSGYADDAFATQLADDARYTFLPKPYTLAQIAEKVKEQLS
ncbi:MAG TPA: response regulator [Hyphomicrobiaceae bacterium]|nr:response regulator [Hyphomicrobiaceae bacterium]